MAAKQFKVNVTKRDITLGNKRGGPRSDTCAIARALRRTFKSKNVSWSYETGMVGRRTIFSLAPIITKLFVIDHDNLEKVKPFSFYVVYDSPRIPKG